MPDQTTDPIRASLVEIFGKHGIVVPQGVSVEPAGELAPRSEAVQTPDDPIRNSLKEIFGKHGIVVPATSVPVTPTQPPQPAGVQQALPVAPSNQASEPDTTPSAPVTRPAQPSPAGVKPPEPEIIPGAFGGEFRKPSALPEASVGGGGGGGWEKEPTIPERMVETFAPPKPTAEMGTAERLSRHFAGGALGTAEGLGGALQWVTGGALGKDFSDYMGKLRKDVTPEGEASFIDQLASGAGSMATFFIPGFGVGRAAGILGKVAPRAAQWLGAGTMAVSEAATEAGQVFRGELEKGKDEGKAGSAAAWTFWLNLPILAVTDKLAFFGNEGKALSRALRGMVSEGSQESLQEVISTWSQEEQQNLKNILTSGAIGAILGGGVGAIAKPAGAPTPAPTETTGAPGPTTSFPPALTGAPVVPETAPAPEIAPEPALQLEVSTPDIERSAPTPEIEATFGQLPTSRADAIRELVPRTGSQESAERFFDLYSQGDVATAQKEFPELALGATEQQKRAAYGPVTEQAPRRTDPPMGTTQDNVALVPETSKTVPTAEEKPKPGAPPFEPTTPAAPMGTGGGTAENLVKEPEKAPTPPITPPENAQQVAATKKAVEPSVESAPAKEPWEMSKADYEIANPSSPDRVAQWKRLQQILKGNEAKNYRPGLITTEQWKNFRNKYGEAYTVNPDLFHYFEDPAGSGVIVKPAVSKAGGQHWWAVDQAIRAGLPVPPEVLADYPDLAAKYAQPTPTPTLPPEQIAPQEPSDEVTPEVQAGKGVGGATLDPLQAVKDFNATHGTAGRVGVPEDVLSPAARKKGKGANFQKAIERNDLAALLHNLGGVDPRSYQDYISTPEERQALGRLIGKTDGIPLDVIFNEAKTHFPDQFLGFEDAGDMVRHFLDGRYDKALNRNGLSQEDRILKEQAEYDRQRLGLTDEEFAELERDAEREVSGEEAAGSGGESAGDYDLSDHWWTDPEPGKPDIIESAFGLLPREKPASRLETRLDQIQADYPGIDREKAAQVIRSLPDAEDGQIVNMAADPEMFAQVARGNLAASEKAQLLKKASDAGAQQGLPGMEMGGGGGLFDQPISGKKYSIQEARQLAPTFYSQMQNHLADKLPGRGAGADLASTIEGWGKKGQLKSDELKWSGIIPWLREQKGPVTKQQILDKLKEGEVRVQVVEKGKSPEQWQDEYIENPRAIESSTTKFQSYLTDLPESFTNRREMLLTVPVEKGKFTIEETNSGYFFVVNSDGKTMGKGYEFSNQAEDALKFYEEQGQAQQTYKVPSAHAYGDFAADVNRFAHVFTADYVDPKTGKKSLVITETQSDWAREGRAKGYKPDPKELAALEERVIELKKLGAQRKFTPEEAAEWDRVSGQYYAATEGQEKGVPPLPFAKNWHEVALKQAIRYAAENGYDGVMVVNGEMVKQRYDLSKKLSKIEYYKKDGGLFAYDHDGSEVIAKYDIKPEQLENYVGKEVAQRLLEQETTSHEGDSLSFRHYRLYEKWAIDQGFTKEEARDEWEAQEHTYQVYARKNPQVEEHWTETPWKTEGGVKTLSGLDLKVGGEWANNLYDKTIPSYLRKYVKQWGAETSRKGVEVSKGKDLYATEDNGRYNVWDQFGEFPLETFDTAREARQFIYDYEDGSSQSLTSFPITPAMRDSVLYNGQAMFRAVDEAALARGLTTEQIQKRLGKGGTVSELGPDTFPADSPYNRGWAMRFKNSQMAMVFEAKDGSLKIGPGDTLGADYAALGITSLEGKHIAGSFKPVSFGSVIELARGNGLRTFDHESWHHIEHWLLNDKERAAIRKQFGDNEEVRAEAYANWNPKEAPNTVFQKILDFFQRITKAITGYQTGEDVFAKARSGEMFTREPVEPIIPGAMAPTKFRVEDEAAKGQLLPSAITGWHRGPRPSPEVKFLRKQTRFGDDNPMVRGVNDMFERTDQAFKELRARNLKDKWENLKRLTIDTSANIKKKLLEEFGAAGQKAEMMLGLSRGATANGERLFKEAESKIYKGLSKTEEINLNRMIYARRILALENYKPDLLMHPELKGAAEMQAYLDSIPAEIKTKLAPRADAYFAAWKANLTAARDAGLINQKSYDAMVNHEYSPRQFIQHLDPEGVGFDARGRKITVTESGIKSLKEGSDQLLNMDSREMLAQGITRTQARIAKNEANKSMRDLAKEVPDNGIVRVAKKIKIDPNEVDFSFENAPNDYDMTAAAEKVIYKWEALGKNETYLKFRENGQEQRLIMSDKFAMEWIHSDPMISSQMATILGYATGAKLLRATATGMNPGFAITNIFRDMAHIWLTTKEYSSFAPKFTLQIGKDMLEVLGDAIHRRGAYTQYISEGGGMSFLTNQGQEQKLSGVFGDIQHYLGWVGETSEILTRLALRNRALKNRVGKPGANLEATWAARNYLDFAQGGGFTKAVDSAVPYLNASVQGTRGVVRAARTDPKLFTWKVAQIGALATGLYLANQLINPDGWDEIPENEKVSNWIITTPFSYTDEMGNKRYHYIRIAKDQGQRVFASVFEGATALLMGKKVDGDQIASALTDFLPIVPNEKLPPALQAMLGYYSNKDFWRNKDLWQGPKVEASEEYTRYTHPVLVKAGELTGASPERLGYALGSMVPPTNTFVSLVGGGLKNMLSDLPEKDREKTLGEIIGKFPMANKFMRTTDPYTPFAKDIEELSVAESTMKLKQRRGLEKLIDANIDKPQEERQEIYKEYIMAQAPEDMKRLVKEVKNYEAYHELSDRKWWLKLSHLDPEVRAEAFYKRYMTADLEEQERLVEYAKKLPGISSDRFKEKLNQLDNDLDIPAVKEVDVDKEIGKVLGIGGGTVRKKQPSRYSVLGF